MRTLEIISAQGKSKLNQLIMGTCINRLGIYYRSARQEADQYCKCPNHSHSIRVVILILLSTLTFPLAQMQNTIT